MVEDVVESAQTVFFAVSAVVAEYGSHDSKDVATP
jgi:hypothetical protein